MSFKDIDQSIKNLEQNIESVQGDLCEGLYSNIIEVSNNLQSNLDEVNILTNDRISNIDPGQMPDFINNYKYKLKINVDEYVKFVRYFNLVNSKISQDIAKDYQLVFIGEKESVIKDIESNIYLSNLIINECTCILEEEDSILRDVNLFTKCGNYQEEIDYINNIIGNKDNWYNRKTNGINSSLGIHELALLKKKVIPDLQQAGYGNIIIGNMSIFSKTYYIFIYGSILNKSYKVISTIFKTHPSLFTYKPFTFICNLMAYGNGLFVAVGKDTDMDAPQKILSSSTSNWNSPSPVKYYSSESNSSESNIPKINCIAYGNNRFVIAGESIAVSSKENKSFQEIETVNSIINNTKVSGKAYGIAYGSDKFVIVGEQNDKQNVTVTVGAGTEQVPAPSHALLIYANDSDLNKWTLVDTGQKTEPYYAVAYGAGKFMVVGYKIYLFDSSSLKLTEMKKASSYLNKINSTASSVAYGNDRFVVITNPNGPDYWYQILTLTTKGDVEPSVYKIKSIENDYPNPILTNVSYDGINFIAVGSYECNNDSNDSNDTTTTNCQTSPTLVLTSSDGITWNNLSSNNNQYNYIPSEKPYGSFYTGITSSN